MSSLEQQKQWDREALSAAAKRMGEFAWPTLIYGLMVVAAYWTTVGMVLLGVINIWLGVLLSAVFTYLAYTTLHESVHGSISGSHKSLRRLNDGLGYLSAMVLMIPMTIHRYEHLAHHRHTNEKDRDPDSKLARSSGSPVQFIMSSLSLYFANYGFYWRHRRIHSPRSEQIVLALEIVVAFGIRLVIVAMGFWQEALALFVLGTLIGLSALVYLFAYIVHRPCEAVGRYVDTSTIRVSGPVGKVLTWLWVFQNYHSIHHLFPKVPFYRYVEVFDEIEAIMARRQAPLYRLTWRGLVPESEEREVLAQA